MEKEIHISILDADHMQLQKELAELKKLGIRHIHLDICDTSFTPSISFGIKMINQILKEDFFFDLHLMVDNPFLILSSLNLQNARCITVHYEINEFGFCLEDLIELRKLKGIDIGLAIKPETLKIDEYVLKQIDRLLIMTVEPGFGGQEFKEEIVSKFAYFRTLFNGMIGVDGGINDKTICKASKADYFVVGSYFYKHPNKKEAILNLKKLASKSDNTVIE